jgi:hypothetical protein
MAQRLAVLVAGVLGLIRDARFWKKAPVNAMTRDGFEIVPDLFDRATCERLVALADSHLRDESYVINDSAYLVKRKQGPRDFDTQISQLMNAQDLDLELGELARSGAIERMFSERLGIDVVLETVSIQLDDVDTKTKRGFHVDRMTPPTFKLFTYLTDVDGLDDGPYTVIPGSHRHVARKISNLVYNLRHGRTPTDMSRGYRDEAARNFIGKAGTTILSAQTLAHKGWHEHSNRRRLCLIAYVSPQASWSGQPFSLGRDFITA